MILLMGLASLNTATATAAPAQSLAQSGNAVGADDVQVWLDGVVPALLEREGIAGAVVSVVHDGEVLTERGYGRAELPRPGEGAGGDAGQAGALVDPTQTLFRIGSVSKLITATAVVELVHEGVLDLDAPVQDHLDFTLPVSFPQPITLRHLLTHTAGFEDKIEGVMLSPGAEVPTLREVVTAEPPEQIFAPGTTPSYSNYSNALAAYVVQRVTGRDYADWATEHVLRASGMSSATFDQPLPANLRARMSKGYLSTSSAEVPFEVVGPAPAGAISATASDMSAFMLTQLGHPTVLSPPASSTPAQGAGEDKNSDAAPLLSLATSDVMHQSDLGPDQLGGLAAGPHMHLGYFDQSHNGHRVLGHAGDLTAFHAQLQIYPEDDTGIFVALNSSGVRPDSSLTVRSQLLDGFADRYFPDQQREPAPLTTSAQHGEAAQGAYMVSRRSESTFARLFYLVSPIHVSAGPGGTLTVSAITDPSGAAVAFTEVEPWVWQEVGGQRRLAAGHSGSRVNAIGLDPGLTLQPLPTHRAVLAPVLAGSLGILVLWVLSAVVVASIRWRYKMAQRRSRSQRLLAAARSVALLGLGTAAVCWFAVMSALLADGVPALWLIRTAQVSTVVVVLGVVPAVWSVHQAIQRVKSAHGRREWVDVAWAAVVVVGFLGLGYGVVVGGLLQPSISY